MNRVKIVHHVERRDVREGKGSLCVSDRSPNYLLTNVNNLARGEHDGAAKASDQGG